MPDDIKQVFNENYSSSAHNWLNDQLRLKKKLEACRAK